MSVDKTVRRVTRRPWPETPDEDALLMRESNVIVARTPRDDTDEGVPPGWERCHVESAFTLEEPDDPESPIDRIVELRRRVISEDTPVWVEVRYMEGGRRLESLRGLEHARTQGDVLIAWRVLLLMREHHKLGRPPGSVAWPDFARHYESRYEQLRQELQRPPTRIEFADDVGMDRKTLGRYLRAFGLGWPPTS